MFEYLSQYSPRELIGLFATGGGILFLMVAVVSAQWTRVRRAELQAHLAEQELALKQQMIERGMSVDEIVRALAAGQAGAMKGSRSKKENAEEFSVRPAAGER
jgi:hypothetical protein